MERSRKLKLNDWTKANDALNLHFEGNKSKLSDHLKMSRTTVTAFFNQKPVREAEFRKICLALRLNWQEVSAIEATAPKQEDWIEEVRLRCCQKILYKHSTIQLLNGTEIGVDQLYVDVWLLNRSPHTFQVSESTLLKSFDLRNDRLGLGDRIKRNEGIDVANKNPKMLILGKPGAGKTTFLKHLAVDCSNGKFQPDLIPVLIELRQIQSAEWKLIDAISEELSLDRQQTKILLDQGRLLILMDGLDEVLTNTFRRNVQNQIRNLAQELQHSSNRFILTCRTQIIEIIPQGFTSVEVADFNDKQVERFVKNWFRASGLTEVDIAQQWHAFSDATEKNPALKELTVTPVLLSLMCWVLQDMGDLPSQTALLYRKGVRLLLERWNDLKEIPGWEVGTEVYRNLAPEQKEALLSEIAARKFENPENFVLFEQKELASQIANFLKLANVREGEVVLKAIETQHGLLVERADELWSFSNLTFQEHFTIQWLTQLSSEQLAEKIVNRQWQEVVKRLVRSQPSSDRLLRLIKQAIDYSISRDAKLQQFLTWIQAKAPDESAIRAFYFACTLAFNLDRSFDLSISLCRSPGSFALDHVLVFTLDLVRNSLDRAITLALDATLALALAFARTLTLDNATDLNCALENAVKFSRDPILANTLQMLRKQLPEAFSRQNWESFQQWWLPNGKVWIEQLHQVTIEHSNVGYDWQFTRSQEQSLQRYYDANNFLVELLWLPGAVSDSVRQEIEDNLLLPIATLRERLPEIYGESNQET